MACKDKQTDEMYYGSHTEGSVETNFSKYYFLAIFEDFQNDSSQ